MTEYLKNNPIAVRTCVMYEFLRSRQEYHPRPPISIYRDVCKVIGGDVMKYSEFDFWFHRFLNEEFDLNFERDKDQKIHELMDMPIVVMEKIVEKLDFFDRVELERTCRSLRTFIIQKKQSLDTVGFNVQNNMTSIRLNKTTHVKCITRESLWGWRCKAVRQHYRKTYWEEAIRGLKKVLKYPKLHLDTLQAYFTWENGNLISISSKFDKELDTPTHQLHLKKLDLDVVYIKALLKLLPYFIPGYLTTIEIDTYRPNKNDGLKELVELEQWKQAKSFSTKGTLFWGPMRHLYHFKEFSVRVEKLSVENIREMKEILFKSPVFERCSLALNDPVDIEQEFGDAIPGSTNIYHYPISDSNEYFEIKVEAQNIEILRKQN